MTQKRKCCCLKWRDISNHDYTIQHPIEAEENKGYAPSTGGILFDKRRVRYCPECGRPLYTCMEILKQLFGG